MATVLLLGVGPIRVVQQAWLYCYQKIKVVYAKIFIYYQVCLFSLYLGMVDQQIFLSSPVIRHTQDLGHKHILEFHIVIRVRFHSDPQFGP